MMKAMVYHEYGSIENLQLQEIEKPDIREDELLVKVEAASVNWLDVHFLRGEPFLARLIAGGLLKPANTILDIDMAGTVEAVGSEITKLRSGDEVFGSTKHGCFAEYVCVHESEVELKPANVPFDQAAAVGAAASTALRGLRDAGKIKSGQKVMVNGASGGVGTFAVQIAKAYETEVTAVCSTGSLELVRSIGADHVIDYTREDPTRSVREFDLIFDSVAKFSFSDCRRLLIPGGIYVTTDFTPGLVLAGFWASITGDKNLSPLPPRAPAETDLAFLKELLEAGKITPVIDKRYPLSELPEALQYLEKGHSKGKVIITVGD